MIDTKQVDSVSFIIYKNGKFLVEKRKPDKKDNPGKIMFPGGSIEAGESFEQTCRREVKEEFGIYCKKFKFIIRLPIRLPHKKKLIHYYFCEDWKGKPESYEAEKIFWIDPKEFSILDFEIDRTAAKEFLKMLKKGGI